MEQIKLVRIDDRLIHGQVATTWIKNYQIQNALVINDELAEDPMQNTILQLASPPGVTSYAFTIKRFIQLYQDQRITKPTLLILTNPRDVLRIMDGGLNITFLNVGGMRNKPGTTQISKSVSITEEDRENFKTLQERGVMIEIQQVPTDSPLPLSKLL